MILLSVICFKSNSSLYLTNNSSSCCSILFTILFFLSKINNGFPVWILNKISSSTVSKFKTLIAPLGVISGICSPVINLKASIPKTIFPFSSTLCIIDESSEPNFKLRCLFIDFKSSSSNTIVSCALFLNEESLFITVEKKFRFSLFCFS